MVRRTARDAQPEHLLEGLRRVTASPDRISHYRSIPISRLDLRIITDNPYAFVDTELETDGAKLWFAGKPIEVEADINGTLKRRCAQTFAKLGICWRSG